MQLQGSPDPDETCNTTQSTPIAAAALTASALHMKAAYSKLAEDSFLKQSCVTWLTNKISNDSPSKCKL